MNKPKGERLRRSILIFIGVMVLCYIGGYVSGMIGGRIRRADLNIETKKEMIYGGLTAVTPMLYAGINVLFFAISYVLLGKYIRQAKVWDGEDEVYIKAVENGFSDICSIGGIVMILNFMLFTTCLFLGTRDGVTEDIQDQIYLLSMGTLIISLILFSVQQALILKHIKRINPEKKGNLFTLNFHKTWMESCDEAQKMIVYRSGYRAYLAVNIVCVICYCVLLVLEIVLQTGLVPIVLVGVIWLVNAIAFAGENKKLDQ